MEKELIGIRSVLLHYSESADMNKYGHSSDISLPAKPVLKSREKSENVTRTNEDQGSSSNDAARGSSSVRRSVTFRDGLHPGYNEIQTSTADTGSSKSKKVFLSLFKIIY